MLGFPRHMAGLSYFNTLCHMLKNKGSQHLKQTARELQLKAAKTQSL